MDRLFVPIANNELFVGFGKATHRKEVDAEPIDDLLLVYFAEQFLQDRPGGRTVAEGALGHTDGSVL